MVRSIPASLLVAAVIAVPFGATKAAYPERPIRLVVPFPPGGGTDLVSRTIQPALQAQLGQQIVIDNRGGAQGLVGTAIAAQAAPDGYTLVIAEIGAIALAPAISDKVQFDPVKDFAPITKLIEQPYIMSVHPSVPAKTLADSSSSRKRRPGALNYGSGNTTAHVAQELFYQTAGIKLQHIPYRGSGPSVAALVEQRSPGAVLRARARRCRRSRRAASAALRSPRSSARASCPTCPRSTSPASRDSRSAAGTGSPRRHARRRPVIARLNSELVKILTSGEAAQQLSARGYDPAPTTPEAFGRYLQSEVVRWTKAVKQFGIKTLE